MPKPQMPQKKSQSPKRRETRPLGLIVKGNAGTQVILFRVNAQLRAFDIN
jgi:hypothetical protein